MARSWRHFHRLLIVLAASTSAVEGAVRHDRTTTYSAVSSLAQQNGAISGAVTDETGGILAGVTITATNLESGRRFVDLSDERGEYRLLNMPPGRYGLEVSRGGFERATVASFELLVGQFESVPFTLKVGGLLDQVTVAGDRSLVSVTSSVVSGNIDRRQMENLPLAGRNWMELSLQVKGIAANDAGVRPGVGSDSAFQLNLDGQQVTNNGAVSTVGQPRFSRNAIAEFQVITNVFDVSQGRSTGVQVQAVSKSGTNMRMGAVYGYFRDDALTATDHVAGTHLPYQNQQVGGSLGGPIAKDRWHYFGSYEHEREPNTVFFRPSNLPNQSFAYNDRQKSHSGLFRADQNASGTSHLAYRFSMWDFHRPFLKNTEHPTQAVSRRNHADNVLVQWSHVRSASAVEELKVGTARLRGAALSRFRKWLERPRTIFQAAPLVEWTLCHPTSSSGCSQAATTSR
jgi:hypothetical protein